MERSACTHCVSVCFLDKPFSLGPLLVVRVRWHDHIIQLLPRNLPIIVLVSFHALFSHFCHPFRLLLSSMLRKKQSYNATENGTLATTDKQIFVTGAIEQVICKYGWESWILCWILLKCLVNAVMLHQHKHNQYTSTVSNPLSHIHQLSIATDLVNISLFQHISGIFLMLKQVTVEDPCFYFISI